MNNMKKVTQQQMRKVYGPSNQQEVQLNAVRKINSLLSSGAVSVTGPIQPRILKQKSEISSPIQQNNIKQLRCYTCDQICTHSTSQCLTQTLTATTKTKLPNKIGRIVGDAFMVIVCEDDVICNQCLQQFNLLDRSEHDVERIRNSLLNSIYRKYGITDDDQTGSPQQPQIIQQPQSQPIQPPKLTTVTTSQPNKIQKLNNSTQYYSRKISSSTSNQSDDNAEEVLTRKIPISQQNVNRSQNIVVSRNIVNNNDSVESQLSNLFEPSNNDETIRQVPVQQNIKKGPIKIYKCMSCEYKASDLKLFQSHYNECKQTQLAQQQQIQAQQQQQIQQNQQQQQVLQTGYRCKICKKIFTTIPALKQHTSEKHAQNQQTTTLMINDNQTIKLEPDQKLIQPQTITQITLYSCSLCKYETQDKRTYDEHLKKHGKLKPFKCRLCSMRFETREQASVHTKTHQPDYFKCGSCSMSFPQREMLIKHFETHEKQLKQQTTQKLLQDTIDEALRGTENHENLETTAQLPTVTSVTEKPINFFTCDICAVTFLQEDYYNQHMETHHKQLITTSGTLTNQTGNLLTTTHNSQNIQSSQQQQQQLSHSSGGGGNTRQSTANIQTAILTQTNQQQQSQQNSISDADLESIFEKIHSDNKNDMDTMVVTTNNGNINSGANDGTNTVSNVVITSQENSGGGITFNITIPQGEELNLNQEQKIMQQIRAEAENQDSQEDQQHHVSIDMPVLETMDETTQQHIQNQIKQQQEENNQDQQIVGGGSVSMPSLDDDVDSQNTHANNDTVAMDLDDVQNSVDDGQIKFILNDGQLLQLNDHIITDSEGNQILVQGTDSEHIQQLLQSVGVIQTSEGLDGETALHMLNENNQMIIVQDGNGETQLIDASMLNADGQIVIQQAHDDDNSQSAGEDGVQIPVSATYTQAGDIEMHHQMHDDGSQDQQHHQIIEAVENSEEIKQLQDHHQQQQQQHQQDEQNKQQQMVISGDHAEHVLVKEENEFSESTNEQPVTTEASSTT